MFKVIKDNKIIGISEEYPTLLDGYEVIEDAEHTCDEYAQYNGEFIFKEDVPVDYKNEQIRAKRQMRYEVESDPLRLDYDEALARGEESAEQLRQDWLASKDKIRDELPYIEEE